MVKSNSNDKIWLIPGFDLILIENVWTVLIEKRLKLPSKREGNGQKHQEAYQ